MKGKLEPVALSRFTFNRSDDVFINICLVRF